MLLALRDGLRSGDVYVPGSRRYADPAAYLLTPEAVGRPAGGVLPAGRQAHRRQPPPWPQAKDELRRRPWRSWSGSLAARRRPGPPRRGRRPGDPAAVGRGHPRPRPTALKDELTAMLPFAPIASLLIELDGAPGSWTVSPTPAAQTGPLPGAETQPHRGAHRHSHQPRAARMADACGISYDILAWTPEWYVREETLRAANLAIIDYHQRLPLTPVVRRRHHVLLGRATLPHPRQVDHRAGAEQVLRR